MMEGKIFGQAPSIDLDVEASRQKAVLSAIQNQLVESATDLSEGGFSVALCEKAFAAEGLGADVTIAGSAVTALFSESQSRFLVTVKAENAEAFENIVKDAINIGTVTKSSRIVINDDKGSVLIDGSVEELRSAWRGAIECLLK